MQGRYPIPNPYFIIFRNPIVVPSMLYLIEGQKEVAFIDVDSLESCGIAIPSVATPKLDLVEAVDGPSLSDNDAICSKYLCSKGMLMLNCTGHL